MEIRLRATGRHTVLYLPGCHPTQTEMLGLGHELETYALLPLSSTVL